MTDSTATPPVSLASHVIPPRVKRQAHLRWVPVAEMRVSPMAQRELNEYRVDRIVASFDEEQIGNPTVSHRDGHYWVIDGQHRIEALRRLEWQDREIQCWTYLGMTEAMEAEAFLKLNDTLTVDAFAKFQVGITAGRTIESDIDRIVRAQGLCVSRNRSVEGAIAAVGTLRRIYQRAGAGTLARTLIIVRDAYGQEGFEAAVIDGIGYLCQRYNGALKDQLAIAKLSGVMGGLGGLTNKAAKLRLSTGQPMAQCIAAAAVDIVNAGKGGAKLPNWWADAA